MRRCRRRTRVLYLVSDSGYGHRLGVLKPRFIRRIPPDSTIPLGLKGRSSNLVLHGSISAYTFKLRRRRRMRWLVWLPKSRTRMVYLTQGQRFTSAAEAKVDVCPCPLATLATSMPPAPFAETATCARPRKLNTSYGVE